MDKLIKFDNTLQTNIDFLVPFTKILVELLSKVKINKWDIIKELNKLNFSKITDNDDTLSVTENFFDYSVSIIYAGTRNFILTIKGTQDFRGFSIIITNKGMIVHSDAEDNSTEKAKNLKDDFLKNYKDPYLLTQTFLNFREQKYG